MNNKLGIIGIDSLEASVLLKYRDELPAFSQLIRDSPTFTSTSVFPVDTIPAWATIYTGLYPSNHGLLYVYDIYDPHLDELKKVNFGSLKGITFWDYISREQFKVNIIFPMMVYPSWNINGTMICCSPYERRIDWLKTEIDLEGNPAQVFERYGMPRKYEKLSGGFPGYSHLEEWAEQGKSYLGNYINLLHRIQRDEDWDLFFTYFYELDVIQHRLWRFYDERDPLYERSDLDRKIFEYYKLINDYIESFCEQFPDADLIVLSDHGHKMRPYKTFNVNEYLRTIKCIREGGMKNRIKLQIKNVLLDIITRFDLEDRAVQIMMKRPRIAKEGKSLYSSSFAFDKAHSVAYLSDFAGIKSYSFGGIEINRSMVPDSDYRAVRNSIISSLSSLKTTSNEDLFQWIVTREDFLPGKFSDRIYPDILFELREDFGTGWDIYTTTFGTSRDHKIASGGHSKKGVFMIRSARNVSRESVHLVDVAPSILDLFQIEIPQGSLDGRSIFAPKNSTF